MVKQLACGRQCTPTQLNEMRRSYSLPQIKQRPAFQMVHEHLCCQRCGQVVTKQAHLPDGRGYCRECLQFGRLVEGDMLISVPECNRFMQVKHPLTWVGQLTPFQAQAAVEIQTVIAQKRRHVLTAVTGAGKTEMLFEGIASALANGERVCVAAPRVAVCMELYPRLQAAFAQVPIMLMHGEQTAPYRYTQLVVCTTHQLLKFYQAFDTVIVDEVDAFPFVENPMLETAVAQACKSVCALIYLTATPTRTIQRAVDCGQMTASELPLRFHGKPLPEPQCQPVFGWRQAVDQKRLPHAVRQACARCLEQQRLLLFVPQVRDLALVKACLIDAFDTVKVTTVHASDPEQLAKIAAFRAGQGDILVTTTILERGVTFKNVAVLVLGAEHVVFNESVLVQIAGRAGRHQAYAANAVYFFYQDYTLAIGRACRQIKRQNQKGRRLQSDV